MKNDYLTSNTRWFLKSKGVEFLWLPQAKGPEDYLTCLKLLGWSDPIPKYKNIFVGYTDGKETWVK